MNDVERASEVARRAFDEAERLLLDDFREATAHAAAAGTLHSGKTVRQFVRAYESRTTQAAVEARQAPRYGRSLPVRVQIARDVGAGAGRLAGIVEQELDRLAIRNRSSDAILAEARQRALRIPATGAPKRREVPRWIGWLGNHLFAALLTLAGGLVLAYFVYRFGWN